MSADNELAILSYQSSQGTRYRAAEASTSGLWCVPPEVGEPLSDEVLVAIFAAWHGSKVFENEPDALAFLEEREHAIEEGGGYIEYGYTSYRMNRDFPTPEEAWEAAKRLGIDKTFRWDKMPESWSAST